MDGLDPNLAGPQSLEHALRGRAFNGRVRSGGLEPLLDPSEGRLAGRLGPEAEADAGRHDG